MKSNFDELGERLSRIFLPEVVMMLRDHDFIPEYIKKEEVEKIIKQINLEDAQQGATNIVVGDNQAMNLQQFKKCI